MVSEVVYRYKCGNPRLLKLKEEIVLLRGWCNRQYADEDVNLYQGLDGRNAEELSAILERVKEWEARLLQDMGPGWLG